MNISHLLRQVINVAEPTGISDAGDPVYGATQERAARVEGLTARGLRGSGGEQVQADFLVWTEEPISIAARVWLPGAATTTANAKRPVKAETVPDLSGDIEFFKTYL